MPVDGPVWERYEQAVQGLPVSETADFEWMLEDPGEFELRVLVRHFAEREELLDRIGRFELDPPVDYTDEEVEELVRSCEAAYRQVAVALVPGVFEWATSTEALEIVHEPADARSAQSSDSAGLLEALFEATYDFDLARHALTETLIGRTQGAGLFYLLGPLLPHDFGFEALLLLNKSGRALWIEDGKIHLKTAERPLLRWIDAPGWNPRLDWPTDADIAEHQRGYRELGTRISPAQDPETSPEVLTALATDAQESVRALVAGNPTTPPEVVQALSADGSRRVLEGLLRRTTVAPDVLERALTHKHPTVRAALAKRTDLDTATEATLEHDEDADVRKALVAREYTDNP